ncbi:MAG: thiamine-phosphate kinase, partial [Acidobacteria bacterium]|nr:thiamine-phosphate kinase [Acidobacteriota bacterium]
MTVADFSEAELIARIQHRLPPAPDWVLVGIGDDAAVVEPERNRVDVLTVDALIEGVHFDRAFAPPDAIGHRALAVNLSDLAAMGAAPRLALLSMALPPALPLDDFDAIVNGFAALAGQHRVHIVGGNLTRSPGPLMIDVTVVGSVKPRQALTRGGARPGDALYVSGTLGAAAAGLQMLREGLTTDDSRLTTDDRRLVTAYLRPTPRVKLGLLIGRNRAASACMDLSDGLADAAYHMAEASGVGLTLDADALPIDAGARAWGEARHVEVMRTALTALTDELRRLKTAGVKTVAVSDESVAVLRRVIAARNTGPTKPAVVNSEPLAAAAAVKPYEPPPPVIRSPVAAVKNLAAPIPAPPAVVLPAGDKQARWNALLALVQ